VGDAVPSPAEITRILHEWRDGSRDALDRLIPLVYNELRVLASRQLASEWRHDRLQTASVVNEAYVKLFDQREVDWQNRGHFFAIASKLMRRILVDHARAHGAAKRGAGILVPLQDADYGADPPSTDVLALDAALDRLATIDARHSRLVELRFFGGLTVEETATLMGVAPITVKRDWALARAWLYRELQGPAR
jgi:RNA polymerase sigma factor (TIGR02999 family)